MTVATDRRSEILDHALALMSERGAQTMSMRGLAKACGVNVATLYHYFGSKAELLRAVIEERRYHELLQEEDPRIDADLPPRERMAAMLGWLWRATVVEQDVWRLLLGESMRRDPVALETANGFMAELEASFERWLGELFPELEGDRAATARVLRGELLSLMVESLLVPEKDRTALLDQRCREVAAVLFP